MLLARVVDVWESNCYSLLLNFIFRNLKDNNLSSLSWRIFKHLNISYLWVDTNLFQCFLMSAGFSSKPHSFSVDKQNPATALKPSLIKVLLFVQPYNAFKQKTFRFRKQSFKPRLLKGEMLSHLSINPYMPHNQQLSTAVKAQSLPLKILRW